MKTIFMITTALVISSCNGGGSSGGGSDSGAIDETKTYTPSYATNLNSICPATVSLTVSNGVVDIAMPSGYTELDLNDFTVSAQTESGGVISYESSTMDGDYDNTATTCGGQTWLRAELSVAGVYNSSNGISTATFVYKDVCDNGGGETEVDVCSGSF